MEADKDWKKAWDAVKATPAWKAYKEVEKAMEATPEYKVKEELWEAVKATPAWKAYDKTCEAKEKTFFSVDLATEPRGADNEEKLNNEKQST